MEAEEINIGTSQWGFVLPPSFDEVNGKFYLHEGHLLISTDEQGKWRVWDLDSQGFRGWNIIGSPFFSSYEKDYPLTFPHYYRFDTMDDAITHAEWVHEDRIKDVKEWLEQSGRNDNTPLGLVSKGKRAALRAKMTKEDKEMARHPNRSQSWLPAWIVKELGEELKVKMVCPTCGEKVFHSLLAAQRHHFYCEKYGRQPLNSLYMTPFELLRASMRQKKGAEEWKFHTVKEEKYRVYAPDGIIAPYVRIHKSGSQYILELLHPPTPMQKAMMKQGIIEKRDDDVLQREWIKKKLPQVKESAMELLENYKSKIEVKGVKTTKDVEYDVLPIGSDYEVIAKGKDFAPFTLFKLRSVKTQVRKKRKDSPRLGYYASFWETYEEKWDEETQQHNFPKAVLPLLHYAVVWENITGSDTPQKANARTNTYLIEEWKELIENASNNPNWMDDLDPLLHAITLKRIELVPYNPDKTVGFPYFLLHTHYRESGSRDNNSHIAVLVGGVKGFAETVSAKNRRTGRIKEIRISDFNPRPFSGLHFARTNPLKKKLDTIAEAYNGTYGGKSIPFGELQERELAMSVMSAGARWGKFGLKQEQLAIKSPMWWTKRSYDLQPSYNKGHKGSDGENYWLWKTKEFTEEWLRINGKAGYRADLWEKFKKKAITGWDAEETKTNWPIIALAGIGLALSIPYFLDSRGNKV